MPVAAPSSFARKIHAVPNSSQQFQIEPVFQSRSSFARKEPSVQKVRWLYRKSDLAAKASSYLFALRLKVSIIFSNLSFGVPAMPLRTSHTAL